MAKYLLEQKNIITHDPNIEKHEETHFEWMHLVGLRHIGKNWVDTLLQTIFGFDFFTLGYIQILICYCQTQPQLQL